MKQRFLILFFAVFFFFGTSAVFAEDINLSMRHKVAGDNIDVTVINNSPVEVRIISVGVELGPAVYDMTDTVTIAVGGANDFHFPVRSPSVPGSYPLTITARYLNDGRVLSLKHLDRFDFGPPAPLEDSCVAEDSAIGEGGEGEITVRSSRPGIWRLVLPEEVRVVSASRSADKAVFKVKGATGDIRGAYPYFAVADGEQNGVHRTAICRGALTVGPVPVTRFAVGEVPPVVQLALAILFLCAAYFVIKRDAETRFSSALGKYSARMFLLSISCYLLKNTGGWMAYAAEVAGWDYYRTIAAISAHNYGYFFDYFLDAYFVVCVAVSLPYFHYMEYDVPLKEDKYARLLKALFSITGLFRRGGIEWDQRARLGFLTFLVKFFFIPLLTTWVINNTFHQINLLRTFRWDFHTVNVFLVALFIYIDTAVFCFGYLFEFKFLKNEIKSVEPTVLGWVVCLWCYPPFNVFSFKMFDHQLVDIARQYPAWVDPLVTLLITVLWGVFTWASVALGFKASNLTNRGIVDTGPYRFVRHPAYTAKIIIWFIQGIFMGQYFLGLLGGFTLMYVLRAWTEERHLSRDPDYLEYKRKVKWKCLPRVY